MLRITDIPTLVPHPRRNRDFAVELEKRRREIAEAKASSSTARARNEGGAIIIGFEEDGR